MSNNKDRVCQTLCDLLSDGLDIHRTIAAQALGHMGYNEAVPDLIGSLLDEDEDVRTDAAAALSELNDPRAAEQLMENLLGDPCPEVKLAAIDALTSFKHQDVVPWLRRMIKGRDEEIVWDEEEFLETGWDDWVDVQVKVIKALAKFGDQESVADIVEAVDDENAQDIMEIVFSALGELGEPGAAALAQFASARDVRQRRRAVSVLGSLGGATASKAIGKALQDEAADVRIAAGRALANRDLEDKRLEMLLVDKSADVRATFVPICGKYHPARLAALLFEQSPDVQSAVLQKLMENPDIADELGLRGRLLEIFEGAAAGPAALAAQAMVGVAGDEFEGEILEKIGDPLCPLDVRLGAIKALAMLDTDASLETLTSVLSDDHRQIRLDAMTAISVHAGAVQSWPNRASEILLAALRGEVVLEPEVEEPEQVSDEHETADEAEIDVAESIDAAQPMLSDDTPEDTSQNTVDGTPEDKIEVQEESFPSSTMAALLGAESPSVDATLTGEDKVELTESDMEFLELTHRSPKKKIASLEAVVAPYQDVRRFAARILGNFAHQDVAVGLAQTMSEFDKELTVTALDSLAHIGADLDEYPQEAVEALLGKIENTDDDVRFGVTRALGQVRTEGAAKLLKKRLKDPSSFVRTEAIRGLAFCGDVGDAVEACLSDEIPAVRLAAAEAISPMAETDLVRRLVNFAFEFEGYHARAVARLLRANNAELARSLFLDVLNDAEQKRVWKVAIEALEELGRPQAHEALAA